MVNTYIGQGLYAFPWSQVVAGFWQKNPNPYSGHVLSEDAYYRTVTEDQIFISKRLLTKTNNIPRWAERVFFHGFVAPLAFIIEESICDLKQKTFTTVTKNISLTTLMTVEETCIYRPDKNDESKTVCEKTAVVTSELYGCRSTLETFAIQRYKKNQELAQLGLEYILYKLFRPQSPLPGITGMTTTDTAKFSTKFSDTAKQYFTPSTSDAL